jgi:neopullulanase
MQENENELYFLINYYIVVVISTSKLKMKRIIIILTFLTLAQVFGQDLEVFKIEPPNWWINHTYNQIQLMVYGKNLDSVNVETNSSNIEIDNVVHPKNTNYSFISLNISPEAIEGEYNIIFSNKYGKKEINFPLVKRDNSSSTHQGFSNEDVVYLISPDRFVNGDTSNDYLFNDKEEFEFGSLNGRHGGDIQGIINKLDYLIDLGITSIWITPLLENNMYMSYHGYSATDLYKIDPRHGTNELYKELVQKAHKKGIKVILDHVANHIGSNHEWINNLPTETWLNGSLNNHLPAEHNKTAFVDIHADEMSIKNANLGWFVDTMPDLNQTDSLLAKYLIQNTIWWVEYSGIDGIREDTYPYANQKFMSEWAKEILTHYPKFNIVGEVWKGDPPILAAFQTNSFFPKEFDSNLPVITDFAIRDALYDYLSDKTDLNRIYEVFGKDFVYQNPNNLLVFFDNHDIDRGMYSANLDIHKYKVALTIILTTRGIPQLYYGAEIGLDGGGHHGRIREEFPGGFPNDKNNAFVNEGRNEKQNDIFEFTRNLLNLRKQFEVIRTGELTQFQPNDNIYIYIKKNDDQKIIFVINDNAIFKKIDLGNYFSNISSEEKYLNLLTNKVSNLSDSELLEVPKNSISIYLID